MPRKQTSRYRSGSGWETGETISRILQWFYGRTWQARPFSGSCTADTGEGRPIERNAALLAPYRPSAPRPAGITGSSRAAGGAYMRPGSGKLGGTWTGKFITLFRSYCGAAGTGAPTAAGRGATAGEAGTGPGKGRWVPKCGSVAGWPRKYAGPGRCWATAADNENPRQVARSRKRRRIGMSFSWAKRPVAPGYG